MIYRSSIISFSLILSVACGGSSADDKTETGDTTEVVENQTQLVEGDSNWGYGTDDVVATTTCTNWAFDCDDGNTGCYLDITGADNDSFSAMNEEFSCELTDDVFSCTGMFRQEMDAMGDGSAIVLTDTTEPYGEILSENSLNIVLPISLSCEGDGCGPIDDHLTLPCEIELDITATLSEG
jgi:hypothetical protein